MLDIIKIEDNIALLKKAIMIIWAFVVALELIFFPSFDALYALLLCSAGLFICGTIVFNINCLLNYSVSTIALLMYSVFFMLLPPIATLIELKPLIYNLRDPFYTFSQLLILQIVLISIHALYRNMSRKFRLKNFLSQLGFFSKLSYQEMWACIIISLLCHMFIILSFGQYNEDGENIGADIPPILRVISLAFGSAYSVVFVFYMQNFNIIKNIYKPNNKLIILVVIIVFVIGIATNMRTAAISCFSAGLFLIIVYSLFYPLNLKQLFTIKNILIYGLVIYFFTGPFMDISRAMLMSRGERYGKSGLEVLTETFAYMDSSKKNAKETTINNTLLWSEDYLSNSILNRFCSLKILDESLFHADRGGCSNPIMRKTLYDEVIDVLPGSVKDMLEIKIDKNLRKYSLTDKLYSLSVPGVPLGGVKIGTLQGLGMSLWGWGYILVLIPLYLVLFYLLDATVLFFENRMYFSMFFIFNATTFVYWFSDRHYYLWESKWIFRTYWEGLFFFFVFMLIIKRLPFIKH